MVIDRFEKSNERGDAFGGIIIASIALLSFTIAAMFTLALISSFQETPRITKSTQALLEAQGYILDLEEVEDLVGTNHSFLTKGGQGPEVTVTFENASKEKVYLDVNVNSPTSTPVLRYASNDSLVASPNAIPKDSKKTW